MPLSVSATISVWYCVELSPLVGVVSPLVGVVSPLVGVVPLLDEAGSVPLEPPQPESEKTNRAIKSNMNAFENFFIKNEYLLKIKFIEEGLGEFFVQRF